MQSTVVERSSPARTLGVDARRDPLPAALQVHLRQGATGDVEARLDQALSCRTVARESVERERVTVNELSTLDTAVMWTSYALGAVVAGSVGAGITRGGEPRRGALLFGVFGLPFLAVGAVESVRALDRSTALAPQQRDVDRGPGPCTPDLERVHLVEAPGGVVLDAPSLSASWRTTALAPRLIGGPGRQTTTPVAVEGGRLVARLTAPPPSTGPGVESASAPATELASAPATELASAPATELASGPATELASAPARLAYAPATELASAPARLAYAPATELASAPARLAPAPATELASAPARPAPAPATELASAPARPAPAPTPARLAPAPAPAAASLVVSTRAPAGPDREPSCAGVVEGGPQGPLPRAFFDQPTDAYEVRSGDWLSKLSLRLFGTIIDYHQLQLLNRGAVADPDRIEVGQTLALPRAPRTLSTWKAEVPEACRVR